MGQHRIRSTGACANDEQKAELDRRLDAYELDKNRGQLATELVSRIRRRL
jgi:putative addiction module component (TIGR02574 family)